MVCCQLRMYFVLRAALLVRRMLGRPKLVYRPMPQASSLIFAAKPKRRWYYTAAVAGKPLLSMLPGELAAYRCLGGKHRRDNQVRRLIPGSKDGKLLGHAALSQCSVAGAELQSSLVNSSLAEACRVIPRDRSSSPTPRFDDARSRGHCFRFD